MIFATVGHELRFDRLIKGLDDWAFASGNDDIFAQVAELGDNGYSPRNFEWQSFLDPDTFKSNFEKADLIVAHAGMGTIITALTMKKPLLIMMQLLLIVIKLKPAMITRLQRRNNLPNEAAFMLQKMRWRWARCWIN